MADEDEAERLRRENRELDEKLKAEEKIHDLAEERERRKRKASAAPIPPFARSEFDDDSRIPPRIFFYGQHYLRGTVGTTIARGGVGKSSLHVAEAVAMALGRAVLGIKPLTQLRVLLWNGEEGVEEIHRRVHAVCRYHRLDYRELNGWLFVASGLETPIRMQPNQTKGLSNLATFIEETRIDVALVDPLVATHAIPEDKNELMDNLLRQWATLANARKIAIDIIHHARKQPAGTEFDQTTADARGASALINAVRSARVLNQMTKEDAERLGIKADRRKAYVRIDAGDKMNYAPSGGEMWIKINSIELGNGDDVGVMSQWKPPGLFDEFSMQQSEQVWARVGNATWRANWRSEEWVGGLVAEIYGLDRDKDRKRIERMIKAWIAQDMLVEQNAKGKDRHWHLFVEAGPNNPRRGGPEK